MTAKILLQNKSATTTAADVLVVVVDGPADKDECVRKLEEKLGGGLLEHFRQAEFQPEKGGVIQVPGLGRAAASQLIFVGIRTTDGGDGAHFGREVRIIEAVATGVRTAHAIHPAVVNVAAPENASRRSLALGATLGAYKFDKYMSKPGVELKQVNVLVAEAPSAADKKEFAVGLQIGQGVCLARDLVNEPPNVLTPVEFAERARKVAKKHQFGCKILDHQGIKKAGMFLHDAVGKGSENLPTFIHLTYKPANSKGKVVFVGKGLTFDSGGLCIKPAPGMPEMKTDMSGGAAVLGMMEALTALEPQIEVHGIIGAAENMPDAKAYRPSDVIPSLSGKGVEIINTDAEGRLVLADALTYASRLKPDFIVDAATLTGATLVSLGPPFSAYFTGSEAIAAAMNESSTRAGESFWRMPLVEELAAQLKSTITDLKHTGDRLGGAITAALFLREFTDGVPWMHCDIPGAVYRERASGMHPMGGTGHAVLTFLELIAKHSESPILSAKSDDSVAAKKPTRQPATKKTTSKKGASKKASKGPAVAKSKRT